MSDYGQSILKLTYLNFLKSDDFRKFFLFWWHRYWPL